MADAAPADRGGFRGGFGGRGRGRGGRGGRGGKFHLFVCIMHEEAHKIYAKV